jgi:hypothetical protein
LHFTTGTIDAEQFNHNQVATDFPERKVRFPWKPQINLVLLRQKLLKPEIRKRDGEPHRFRLSRGKPNRRKQAQGKDKEEADSSFTGHKPS